ncbi:outer membrane protein [Colwellia sp. RE-S-Sl-9]
MSKKYNLLSVAALLTTAAISSQAHAGDWYISANAGYSDPSSKVFNDGTNGPGTPKSSIDSDMRYGIAVGFEVLPALKVELEYSLASYDTDANLALGNDSRALDNFAIDANLDVDLLTLNVSYEFKNTSQFTPFIKGGVGSSFYDASGDLFVGSFGGSDFGGFLPRTFEYEGDGNEFAYFVGAGVAMEVSNQVEVTLEYRYSDLGEVATGYDENGDRLQTNLDTNDIQLGLRYSF